MSKEGSNIALAPGDPGGPTGPTTMDRILRRSWNKWDHVVPTYIRTACLTWQFIKFSFQFYLCTRQHKVLTQRNRMPHVLFGKLAPETFEKAKRYHKELLHLEMFSCLYWIVYEVWTIYFAGYTKVWFLAGPILDALDIWDDEWDRETGETIIFISSFVFLSNFVRMPLEIFQNFVIEEKYGFNKMTFWQYLWDKVKLILMEAVWSVTAGLAILWIVKTSGKLFFIWVWLFCFVWLVATLAIYPNLVAPMFNQYTKLREGRLRNRLNRLAHFIGFPLEDILVLHQNWKTEHRDAYFYGLVYTKRIVLFDTLLTGYPEADTEKEALFRRNRLKLANQPAVAHDNVDAIPSRILHRADSSTSRASMRSHRPPGTVSRVSIFDKGFTEYEIEAICARLMGHWVLSHSVQEMVFPEISLFLFFIIFSYVYENSSLFQAFEVPKNMDKPIILGLRLLFLDVMDIYKIFVDVVMRYMARQRELESDSFATKLGYGDDLIDAIIELNKENLGFPFYDEWYWSWHRSEPSLLQRIEAIETEMLRMEWRNR